MWDLSGIYACEDQRSGEKKTGISPLDVGGAEGTRTPDPLVANEVRYQLRHSPVVRTKR